MNFWIELATQFKQQNLIGKLSFILPFIGFPTILGILASRHTKTQMRKVIDGKRSEILVLQSEIEQLKKSDLDSCQDEIDSFDPSLDRQNVEALMSLHLEKVGMACSNIALRYAINFWESGEEQSKRSCLKYAKISIASIGSPISKAIYDDISGYNNKFNSGNEFIHHNCTDFVAINDDIIENSFIEICRKFEQEYESGNYLDAANAMRILFFICNDREQTEGQAYNYICLTLVRCFIEIFTKKPLYANSSQYLDYFSDELLRSTDKLDIIPPNARAVCLFHYASAKHLVGNRENALQFLEERDLPNCVSSMAGENSSANFATKHLYVNLLFECHRHVDAVKAMENLIDCLKLHGKFSNNHELTYRNWRSLAERRDYLTGAYIRFKNFSYLSY